MSAKTIKPSEVRRRRRLARRVHALRSGLTWRQAESIVLLRSRHLATVNDSSQIPAPRHKPHRRRERRGQTRPR